MLPKYLRTQTPRIARYTYIFFMSRNTNTRSHYWIFIYVVCREQPTGAVTILVIDHWKEIVEKNYSLVSQRVAFTRHEILMLPDLKEWQYAGLSIINCYSQQRRLRQQRNIYLGTRALLNNPAGEHIWGEASWVHTLQCIPQSGSYFMVRVTRKATLLLNASLLTEYWLATVISLYGFVRHGNNIILSK